MSAEETSRKALEEVARLYPKLFSEKRLDEWARLFSPHAVLIRVERGAPTTYCSLPEAMPEQIEYAEENSTFEEVWENVEIHRYGHIATIKADYRLTVDHEIREGVDVLTLVNEAGRWQIITLAYQQNRLREK